MSFGPRDPLAQRRCDQAKVAKCLSNRLAVLEHEAHGLGHTVRLVSTKTNQAQRSFPIARVARGLGQHHGRSWN